jgi:hypothetical protein
VAVTDFHTKVAVVVRDDLAAWQKLNVTAFLISGVIADSGETVIGDDYLDADGARYLPMLVQPVLIYIAGREKLQTIRRRAADRDISLALYINEMFATGHDADNRAAVRAVHTEQLDLVGLGLRAAHRDADAILRGLKRHP